MAQSTAWILLVVAGLMEVGWAIGLKLSQGFTRPLPSALTALLLGLSMFLLAKASSVLPMGTAYAVWVGIGALGTALLGILVLREPATPARIFFLSMLLLSIVGLKFSGE